MARLFGITIACLLASNAALGALSFDRIEAIHEVQAKERVVFGTFPFTNRGTQPVLLESAATTCACTKLEFDRRSYAPGESGSIRYQVTVGVETGRSFGTVRVTTDDSAIPGYSLRIELRVAPLVRLQRSRIHWPVGGKLEAQKILVTSLLDEPIAINRINLSHPERVKAIAHETKLGTEFELLIEPMTTNRPFDDRVDIVIETRTGIIKSHSLFIRAD